MNAPPSSAFESAEQFMLIFHLIIKEKPKGMDCPQVIRPRSEKL
jgi:hypothetical protein